MYEYLCKIECDETIGGGTNTDLSGNYLDGYKGCQDHTIYNDPCVTWDKGDGGKYVDPSKGILSTSKFCRNPNQDPGGIWCYYKDKLGVIK